MKHLFCVWISITVSCCWVDAFLLPSTIRQPTTLNTDHRHAKRLVATSSSSRAVAAATTSSSSNEYTSHTPLDPQSSYTAAAVAVVEQFLQFDHHNPACHNNSNINLSRLVTDDCIWDDYTFYQPSVGAAAVERQWRLWQPVAGSIDFKRDWLVQLQHPQNENENDDDDDDENATLSTNPQQPPAAAQVGVVFTFPPGRRACAWFHVVWPTTPNSHYWNNSPPKIQSIQWTVESTNKGGEDSLKLLTLVSPLVSSLYGRAAADASSLPTTTTTETLPERYFDAWNRRDMDAAVQLFTDDIIYHDLAFPIPLVGKQAVEQHLKRCAAVFPDTFTFCVDQILMSPQQQQLGSTNRTTTHKMMVQWHVENQGVPMPFSRGLSVYTMDNNNNNNNDNEPLIRQGTDWVEPGPIKTGQIELWSRSLHQKFLLEPARIIPLTVWIAYMYIVFISDGILPGANALQLEARTWQEVRDLSLNFFLVAPALHLPFSPVVHPLLEGVFNWLLAWAALFAGFLSDDRRHKPCLFPMIPAVVGMQFLTSAFLLPYLVTRTSEDTSGDVGGVYQQDLSLPARLCESRAFAPFLAFVGTCAIGWGLGLGRVEEFGGFPERWTTFIELLSMDRVGSSFIVDLVIFGLFQPWLVNDDMKRRGMTKETVLTWMGKYVPFFGMAAYMTLRPTFPSR